MKKKIRLAIIGCGGFVRYHVAGIRESVPEADIVGLCDIIPERAEKLAQEIGEGHRPQCFKHYADMLAAVPVDGVLVSTPHTLHFEHAYAVLAAGANVMVDKPMVTDPADARRLVAQAKRKKLLLSVAMQGVHTAQFAYARHLIDSGALGEPQLVTGVLAQDWKDLTRGWWRQKPALSGGGQLYDSCCHLLSAMMVLVHSPAREVFCFADNKGTRVDINAVGGIRFANGCIGSITSGGNCGAWKSQLIFQGKEGCFEIGAHGGGLNVYGKAFPQTVTEPPGSWKVKTVVPVRNFVDAIKGKAPLRCDGRVGILMADLMKAMYQSAKTARVVRV
ncbi:MAG: Gfo/Idh/MocA family oxidoreductase [Planctomycetaceae bacterium]|nr:Gfo/Idh/MocA family oxidoreductase [Planctomycetaceae bacterium]